MIALAVAILRLTLTLLTGELCIEDARYDCDGPQGAECAPEHCIVPECLVEGGCS